MRVEFHPFAEEEFVEETACYEQQAPSLGGSFIAELESAAALLEEHPELGVEIEDPLRQLPMRRFPHSLFMHWKQAAFWP